MSQAFCLEVLSLCFFLIVAFNSKFHLDDKVYLSILLR